MTSDHHSLQGAGNQHSPALPLSFAFCEVCGAREEDDMIEEGMCRECIGVVREGLLAIRETREPPSPITWYVMLAVSLLFWGVFAAIVWRWVV